jgi:hypothetical protein
MNISEYENYLNSSQMGNINYNDNSSLSSSSSSEQEEEEEIKERNNYLPNPNIILNHNNNLKENKEKYVTYKDNILLINSIDRDFNDPNENRFNFKIKFAPSSNSYTKKYTIYENSKFFMQTTHQKEKGLQGFPRNIQLIKYREESGWVGYLNAYRDCSTQEGNLIYNPNEPQGNLVGYNYLYEQGDENQCHIQKKFSNIKNIEIKKIIIPTRILTYPYNISLYGDILTTIPYINLTIPELNSNYYSTTPSLRKSFSVLVPENTDRAKLDFNQFGYIHFVPITEINFDFIPPSNGLNCMSLKLSFPPCFTFSNPAVETFSNTEFIDSTIIDKDYRYFALDQTPFQEVQDIYQITMFKKKKEISSDIWKRRATCSGVTQPASFLQDPNPYENPGLNNKEEEVYCLAITTQNYFRNEIFSPGTMCKIINYFTNFSELFSNNLNNLKKNDDSTLNIEYYIPDIFNEDNSIWENIEDNNGNILISKCKLREESKQKLINLISLLIGKLGTYFTNDQGMPIIDIGNIDINIKDLIPINELNNQKLNQQNIEEIKVRNKISNELRNCYQYLNSRIYIKNLGKNINEIKFCNVENTTKEDCNCLGDNEYMSGMCKQITSDCFGDYDGPFFCTKEGFYKNDKKKNDIYNEDDGNNKNIKKISCGNICIDINVGKNDYPCLKSPNVKLGDIKTGDYPSDQNQFCNGLLEENNNNLCTPCYKFKSGPNSNGLCNTIIVPIPYLLVPMIGKYYPLGIDVGIDKSEIVLEKNLGYDKNKIRQVIYEETLLSIAFSIIKEVLFNGGPLSFPSKKDYNNRNQVPSKIVSITNQNMFVFNIKTEEANMNKII